MNRIIRVARLSLMLAVVCVSPSLAEAPAHVADEVTPIDALKRLVAGNRRFTAGKLTDPHRAADRRADTFTNGQHPFAAILTCADSRVPTELVFDQGIGDLFVVRVAGNVSDHDEIGTIEYGVEHLGARLIVVMGHTKCGAVTAVVNSGESSLDSHADLGPNLTALLDNIGPAAATARAENPGLKGNDLVPAAIRANVMQSIQDMLTHSKPLSEAVKADKIKVVGAIYNIQTGTVEWLGTHPNEVALLNEPQKKPVEVAVKESVKEPVKEVAIEAPKPVEPAPHAHSEHAEVSHSKAH